MGRKVVYTLLLFYLLINGVVATNADTLDINVTTDKQLYGLGETVQIHGNLTWNNSPVAEGLVAMQVDDSKNITLVLRTLSTGTPPENPLVEILAFYSCDSHGNPKGSFQKGTEVWFNMTIRNNDNESRKVMVAYNIYDIENIPFTASVLRTTTLEPGEPSKQLWFIPLPDEVALGAATAYANLFTDRPKNNGASYCPEKNATFMITSTGSSAVASLNWLMHMSSSTEGTYNLSFRLPYVAYVGNYTTYVASQYQGQSAANNITFEVVLIGDVNGDGIVELKDFYLTSVAFGSKPGDPNWNPNADVAPWPDGDGIIELKDFFVLSQHFGQHASQ